MLCSPSHLCYFDWQWCCKWLQRACEPLHCKDNYKLHLKDGDQGFVALKQKVWRSFSLLTMMSYSCKIHVVMLLCSLSRMVHKKCRLKNDFRKSCFKFLRGGWNWDLWNPCFTAKVHIAKCSPQGFQVLAVNQGTAVAPAEGRLLQGSSVV